MISVIAGHHPFLEEDQTICKHLSMRHENLGRAHNISEQTNYTSASDYAVLRSVVSFKIPFGNLKANYRT